MNLLEARRLAIGYRSHRVGENIDLAITAGEVLCLLGPNGGGKTTLFRTLLGVIPALAGEVRVANRPLCEWSRRDLARHIGYVPQVHAGLFAFTVEDVVLMGRTARMSRFGRPLALDHAAALTALKRLGIASLAGRIYTQISGGERQLTLIARALAQEASVLILDEPTASLDFGNQIRVLTEIERLRNDGIAVLMSTHHPEHALMIADRIALLKSGCLISVGSARETVTPEMLAALYNTDIDAVIARMPSVWSRS